MRPFVVWHYTRQCNLNCTICYESAGKCADNELSLVEKMTFVDQVAKINPRMLAFSGGEAASGKDFYEVITYASKRVPVCLSTNGYDIARHLDRLKNTGVEILNFSIYSTSKELHDAMRGGNGGLEKVVNAIKDARAKKFKIELSIPLTKSNFSEVEELINLGKSLHVNEIELLGFCKTGYAKNIPQEDLTPEQRIDLLKKAYDNTDKKTRVWCFDPRYPQYRNSRDKKDEVLLGCDAGSSIVAVQPDGIVTPCPFIPDLEAGNVRDQDFSDIYKNSPLFIALRDRNNLQGNCGSCSIKQNCGGCRAKAFAATKNVFAGDDVCKKEFVKVIKNE